jgi:hypothetical protein
VIQNVINRLLLLCVLASLAGAAFIVLFSDGSSQAARAHDVTLVIEGAFAYGVWGYLGRASVVSVGVAAALSAVNAAVNLRKDEDDERFRGLGQGNVREHVKEVARRVEACLTRDRGGIVQSFDELVRGAIAIEASDIHM